MEIFIVVILQIATFCLGLVLGLRSRKHPLQNKTQAEALMYFLEKEQLRHQKDIVRCKADMWKLAKKYGVKFQEANAGDWIDP